MTETQDENDVSIFADADLLEEADLKAAAFLKYTEGLEKAKATEESIKLRNKYLYGDTAEPEESDKDVDFVLTQIARDVDLLEESFIPDEAHPLPNVLSKCKSCPLFSNSDDQDFIQCRSQRSSTCDSWDYDTQFIELASNADMIESLLDSDEKYSGNPKAKKNNSNKKCSLDVQRCKSYELYTIDEEINTPDEEMKDIENISDRISQSKDDSQSEAVSPIIVRSQFRKYGKKQKSNSRKRLLNSKSKENITQSKDTCENNKKLKQNEVEDVIDFNQIKSSPIVEVDLNTQEEFFNQFSEFMILDTQSDVTNNECSQKKLSQDLKVNYKNECINQNSKYAIENIATGILKQKNNIFCNSLLHESNKTEINKIKDYENVAFGVNNKKISVSDSAFKNVENIFSDIKIADSYMDMGSYEECFKEEINERIDNKEINYSSMKSDNKKEISLNFCDKNFNGFMTASNKKIIVSNDALQRTKHIFEDNNINDSNSNSFFKLDKKLKEFTIGNNKNLGASHCLLKEVKSENESYIYDKKNLNNENFPMFMTASEKNIKISRDALKKAKQLFVDIDDNKASEAKEISYQCSTSKVSDNDVKKNQNSIFKGFMTASNKNIEVSEKSLQTVKHLFEEDDEMSEFLKNENLEFISNPLLEDININNRKSNIGNKNFQGFTTASNKEIKISDDALQKVKRIFNDIDTNIVDENCKKNTSSPLVVDKFICSEFLSHQFDGFMTASNKKIKVSDEAVQKVKNMFENIEKDEPNISVNENIEKYNPTHTHCMDFQNTNIKESNKNSFKGFMTASNKNIKVSDEAVRKVKNMFENIEKDELNISVNENIEKYNPIRTHCMNFQNTSKTKSFKGFMTASNKNIKVSDEAVQKVKNMFENIEKDELNISVNENIEKYNPIHVHNMDFENIIIRESNVSETFNGFMTASNKNILISDNSLQKVKDIFKSIDPDVNEIYNNNMHEDKFTLIDDKNFKAQQTSDLMQNKMTDETFNTNDAKEVNETENFSFNKDIEPPLSPILQFKGKRKRKTFRAPFKQNPEANNEIKRRKVEELPIELDNKNDELKAEKKSAFDFLLGNVLNEKMKNKNKTITLKILYRIKKSTNICNDDISTLSNSNFMNFIFNGDRCDLIMQFAVTQVAVPDIVDLFMGSNEINKKLIPNGWVINHIKWIMWKLASYERQFSGCFTNEPILKITNILKQLKYRYDRELYSAQRPILRKVLEKDDVSSKRMVLCVSNIVKINTNDTVNANNRVSDSLKQCEYEIELTDGWYSVMTVIDSIISSQIAKAKIVVGTKLMIYGAELLNCPQGVAPLEDDNSVRLKIWANSCRRCLPWIKLGLYTRNTGPMNISLGESKAGGGPLALIRFVPITVYQMFFLNKSNDGSIVMRSQKLQEIYNAQMETEVQEKLEQLYVQAEKEILSIEKGKKNEFTKISSLKGCNSTEDLVNMLEKAADPQEFMGSLTTSQQKAVQQFVDDKHYSIRQKIDSRVQELIQELGLHQKQNVRVLKTRIVTLGHREPVFALLTIWRPDDTTIEMIKEGLCLDATNITPTGIKNGEFQVSAGKRSSFQEVPSKKYSEQFFNMIDYRKNCVPFEDFYSPNFAPKFNEVDIVGIVVAIEPKMADVTKNIKFQTVYMVDKNMTFLAIVFWSGIAKTGFQKIIEEGQCLACLNLQHRTRTLMRKVRQLYATEFSVFTRHCKKSHIEEALCDIEKFMKQADFQIFLTNCKNELRIMKHDTPKIETNKNLSSNSKYKFECQENIDEYCVSDLDFESTFIDTSCKNNNIINIFNDERDSFNDKNSFNTCKINISSIINENKLNNSKNVSSVEARINKLKMYGEPPPLSPIAFKVTNQVKRSFVPPFHNADKSGSSSNVCSK